MAGRATKSAKTAGKAQAKTMTGRETLVSLRAHVDEIEKRLSHADKLTKSSVRALKSSFKKLNERTNDGSGEQDLTAHIEALSDHLTGLIEKTREDVAHDLQIVLQDPRLETISTALTNANRRITKAETEQAGALRAINEQIARLATVVDQRLQRETDERAQSQQILKEKIDQIEHSSAQAVTEIGDKVVSLADELNQRSASSSETLKQEISHALTDHQQILDTHKSDISRRIEAIEDDQRNSIPSIERRLVTMASRLELLEAAQYAQTGSAATPPPGTSTADAFSPPEPTQPAVISEPPAVQTAVSAQPALEMTTEPMSYGEPLQDSLTALPQEYAMAEPLQPPLVPVSTGPIEYAPEEHAPQEYVPQEYVPQEYVQQENAPLEYTTQSHSADIPQDPAYMQNHPSHAPFNYETGSFEQAGMAGMAAIPQQTMAPPPPQPVLAKIQDAFFEPEQSLEAARPGGEDIIPKSKRGLLSRLKNGSAGEVTKSSPIKLFALMTAIAVVGLFAAQKILPFGGEPSIETSHDNISQSQLEDRDPRFADPIDPGTSRPVPESERRPQPRQAEVVESLDVVGDYSDAMQPPELEPSANGIPSVQQLTLETAAINGDMVAQFQMGLSHLEAGRTAEAVKLIRLSANQGQPAAQYRLAKLYENGVGLEKDLATALNLLGMSARSGNRIAMHDLGHYHATGTAMAEPDIVGAVKWFQEAADRGVLDSQFNLGVLYQEGSGVNRSPVDAYIWYSIAGSQGDEMAVQRSEVIARDLSGEELDQARARVKAFTPKRIGDSANGIFKNTPWSSKVAGRTTARTNEGVMGAQRMLAALGYQVGTPDGAMGPKTRNAIIRFERAVGLPETGRVTSELIDRLSLAAGA